MDWLTRQLERGLFALYVLWVCSKKPVCGLDLLKAELKHGHEISAGRLYPTLNRLVKAGLLSVENRKEHGKIHKYYATTREGLGKLSQVSEDLGEPMKVFLSEWLDQQKIGRKQVKPLGIIAHHE